MSERESCVCVCSSLPLACFKRPDVPRSRFNHPAVLQSQYGVVPLASIARLEIGVTTYTVGGNIYVRADDTSLQSAADLSGRKVRRSTAFWLLSLLQHRVPPMLDNDCNASCR